MSSSADVPDGVFGGPRTLTIMPTFACPASCRDCGTMSHPGERHRLDLDTMLAAIRQAPAAGFVNVVFSGGEPTVRWSDLLQAIRAAAEVGLPTRVVTNACWAGTTRLAGEKLSQLREAGLDEINYSTGDEHARFIPLDNVIRAAVVAIDLGFAVHVMCELRRRRRITKEAILSHPRIKALPARKRALLSVRESPWMPLDHRRVQEYPAGTAIDHGNVSARQCCDSVLQTYVLMADGRITACCGLAVRLIPEMHVARAGDGKFLEAAVREAEEDFLKVWLRYKGPEQILRWAAERDPSIEWEGMYAHRCQTCKRIYHDPRVGKVIREGHREMFLEILQCIWLDEMAGKRLRESRPPAPAAGRPVG